MNILALNFVKDLTRFFST